MSAECICGAENGNCSLACSWIFNVRTTARVVPTFIIEDVPQTTTYYTNIKGRGVRAASHRDLYAPKRPFPRNTASKSHGRRQPYHGFFLCLAMKILSLACFAVLNRRFFLTGSAGGRRNTGCISRPTALPVGKKIHSKPCKSLCESAQCRGLGIYLSSSIGTSMAMRW